MFTDKEKEMFYNPYFNIISEGAYAYEIQSKNTGNYWKVMLVKNHTYVKLFHKYNKKDKYHVQTTSAGVFEALLEIICHDDYKLNIRSSFFEEFVRAYS